MTNDEKAQVLDNHAANARMQEKCYRVVISDLDDLTQAEQWRRVAEAIEAGAAALRREQWKPIQKIGDGDELPPEFLAGGRAANGKWIQSVEGNPNHALLLGFTHYRKLTAPPEGV